MPIWKPFMAWMAAWALDGLSKLTKPAGREEPSHGGEGEGDIRARESERARDLYDRR